MTVRPAPDAILPLVLEDVDYAVEGRPLVEGLSLVLEPGPLTCVLGFNGAGKSLFLRLCHGLIRPTHGRVGWAGPGRSAAARHQAMVFQRPVMLRRSVRANLDYPLRMRGVPRARRRETVERMLSVAGLSDIADRPARVLSGGQQQRLALARAWGLDPQVAVPGRADRQPGPRRHQGGGGADRAHPRGRDQDRDDDPRPGPGPPAGRRDRLSLHRGRLAETGPAAAFFAGPESPAAAAFVDGRLA